MSRFFFFLCLSLLPNLFAESDRIVARVFNTPIYLKEIEPSRSVREAHERTNPSIRFEELLPEYQNQKLTILIWRSLKSESARTHDVSPTEGEIEAFVAFMMAKQEEVRKLNGQLLREKERQLQEGAFSPGQRPEIQKNLEALKSNLAANSDEAKKAFREMAMTWISKWKFDRILYEKYKGTVIRQQAGFEPIGAYRQFLEEREKAGDFKIEDDTLRKVFWKYYTQPHPFEIPESKVDFSKPWWLLPETSE